MIKLAKNLELPLEAVTQTFAILAKRGVGKTHAASVMAEEMLRAGQPIVAYDPTGAWFGLKSTKDGKRPAYPVVIFGGEHADVPLEESAGQTIASVIIEKRFPAILDCSLLRKGARIRFMTDFCETLYHKNRESIHFFVDEAQTIAPQNLRTMPEAARLLGAMEDILLQGRRRGIGATIISPRPAVVNTNIRSACEVIIAMQIIGPHDRKAISEWVDAHGDDEARAKEMMASLSSLKRGEAWVWSPSWLNLFRHVHFRDRETFDSSATPVVGGKVIAPTRMAEVDLEALGAEIQSTIAKAKADDPKELKRRIAELEKQIKNPPKGTTSSVTITDEIIQRNVTKAIAERDRHWQAEVAKLVKAIKVRDGRLQQIETLAHLNGEAMVAVAEPATTPAVCIESRIKPAVFDKASTGGEGRGEGLTKRQQNFLDAAATLSTLGVECSRETVSAWVGVHPRGGSVGETLKSLEDAGLITIDRGQITVTDAGADAAGQVDPAEAISRARDGLTPRQAKFFDSIAAVHPGEITRELIAEQHGLHPRGGSLGEDLGRLVGRGLVENHRGRYRCRDFLFAGS